LNTNLSERARGELGVDAALNASASADRLTGLRLNVLPLASRQSYR
jgi:hypothetical protein